MSLELQEPTDALTNGQVTIELTISDEVAGLGIVTQLTDFDSEKTFVTRELHDHLLDYNVDVRDHGVDVVEP